jgi:hypothetical protein
MAYCLELFSKWLSPWTAFSNSFIPSESNVLVSRRFLPFLKLNLLQKEDFSTTIQHPEDAYDFNSFSNFTEKFCARWFESFLLFLFVSPAFRIWTHARWLAAKSLARMLFTNRTEVYWRYGVPKSPIVIQISASCSDVRCVLPFLQLPGFKLFLVRHLIGSLRNL